MYVCIYICIIYIYIYIYILVCVSVYLCGLTLHPNDTLPTHAYTPPTQVRSSASATSPTQ